LGAALARSAGAGGMAEAVARKRKWAETETKLRPKFWIAHCSGVRVLPVCVTKGSYSVVFGISLGEKGSGEVRVVVKAWNAAFDVKSEDSCQEGACIVGVPYSNRVAKYPKLPKGSIVKGMRVMFTWLRLAVVPCL
jgi:hypothetical protein